MYPIVIFDALRVKIRDTDSRMVKNKAVYIALGVTREGEREVLGLWIADNEGAKFWLSVMNELRNRGRPGHPDRRRGRTEGLPRGDHRGLPRDHGPDLHRASDPAFHELLQLEGPQGRGRRSAPHLPGPDRRGGRPPTDAFEEKWAGKYPSIAPAWRRAWAEVTPF
jgi:putative transposase